MHLEVGWHLMFRVNDAVAADRCLQHAQKELQAEVVEAPKPYWKIPEWWEVSLKSSFAPSPAEGVYELLRTADRLASDWYVTGPLVVNNLVSVFEGVFDAKRGRPHVAGLVWASFSVGGVSADDGA